MVIFRENSEDIYAGIEMGRGSPRRKRSSTFCRRDGRHQDPFPRILGHRRQAGVREGTERLVRKAIRYAIDNDRDSVTLVHKGNIMKFTEGAFKDWGYELAKEEFGADEIDGGPWCSSRIPRPAARSSSRT